MKIITADPSGRSLRIETPYDPVIVAKIRDLPVRKFTKVKYPHWKVPLTTSVIKPLIDIAISHEFAITPEAERLMRDTLGISAMLEKLSDAVDETFEVKGLKIPLRKYQQVGVKYSLLAERVLIGDSCGVGKTGQAIAAVHFKKAFPCLIVCPNIAKLKWKDEIGKFLNGTPGVEVITPQKYKRGRHYTIINYDLLSKYETQLKSEAFKSIIFDECHRLRHGDSMRTKAAKRISKDIPMRLGLSGTPVLNAPRDLISQLDVLGRLEEMGGFFGFTSRYCGAYKDDFGHFIFDGATNQEEMIATMRRSFLLMRTLDQVMPELPALMPTTEIEVELSNQAEYDQVKDKARSFIEDSGAYYQDGTTDYEVKNGHALKLISQLRQLSGVGKLESVLDWLTDFLESGEKIVLFAHHKEIIKRVSGWFPHITLSITGDDTAEEKYRKNQKFQKDDEIKIVVCSLTAASEVLDFNRANYLGVIEWSWTKAEMDQAIARVHRSGVSKPVFPYLFKAKGIDDYMLKVVSEKEKLHLNNIKLLREIIS